MGGHGHEHGHGHHHEPYVVPKPEYYANKVDKVPELVMVQEELAKRGLKDPWLRNEVWRYDKKIWGVRQTRIFKFIFRGLPVGAVAFAATVGIEYALGVYDKPHGGHGDHGGHGEH